MRFHSIKSYYKTSLFFQILSLNIETSLFCKIMRLKGVGGDALCPRHKHMSECRKSYNLSDNYCQLISF